MVLLLILLHFIQALLRTRCRARKEAAELLLLFFTEIRCNVCIPFLQHCAHLRQHCKRLFCWINLHGAGIGFTGAAFHKAFLLQRRKLARDVAFVYIDLLGDCILRGSRRAADAQDIGAMPPAKACALQPFLAELVAAAGDGHDIAADARHVPPPFSESIKELQCYPVCILLRSQQLRAQPSSPVYHAFLKM